MAAHPATATAVVGNHRDLAFMTSVPLRSISLSFPFSASYSSTYSPLSTSLGFHSLPVYPGRGKPKQKGLRVDCAAGEPLKVMISGALASGKGVQCRMIADKATNVLLCEEGIFIIISCKVFSFERFQNSDRKCKAAGKIEIEWYGLVHISTVDILRAEVSSGSEIGNKAKEYMDNGKLVPDEIVTDMVMTRLSLPDVKERGWLLDGYPRSFFTSTKS